MSYSPDNPPPGSGSADGDGSMHEDRLILSALVRGVDIMEIYSPSRVTEVCREYGLEPGESLDSKSGWDLSDRREQQRARALVRSRAPYLVICSPPFIKFSNLQNLNKAINGPEWHEKFAVELEQAKAHVRFCVELMREQLAAGRHFLFEHPAWASSWDMPELQSLADKPGVLCGNARTSECTAWSRRMRMESTRLRRSRQVFSGRHGASLMSCRCVAITRTSISTR